MNSNYDPGALRTCQRCNTPYSWQRSPASLKMTYCGSLCEMGDLGFTLEALERYQPPSALDQAEAVAAGAWHTADTVAIDRPSVPLAA